MTTEASVVISTFNRADALGETLRSLSRQDVPADSYEVIVVDDGSTDRTQAVLSAASVPYRLRTVHHLANRGVSAGRNSGIRIAEGRYLIFLSDDLLVPANFISGHLAVHERFPSSWVVGGFRQLDSLTDSTFGRYLDDLEGSFDEGRREAVVAAGIWEMNWPTARNLSLARSDLDQTGLFDARFRTCCEDQDLAERARAAGIRFLYTDGLDCLHNDQAGDLERYCRFQERGAIDTVLYVAKSYSLHGQSALVSVNGPIRRGDGWNRVLTKVAKRVASSRLPNRALLGAVRMGERVGLPEPALRRCYRFAIGIAIFRGWRAGLRRWGDPHSLEAQERAKRVPVAPAHA